MTFAPKTAAIAWLTRLIDSMPVVERAVTTLYSRLRARNRISERSPFDRSLGIDTTGFLPPFLLSLGREGVHANPYLGCAPGVLRHVLARIPAPQNWRFIDLGCGKGRALAVASELPFRALTGLELSRELVRVARANAREIARRHPERTPIEVALADASRPDIAGPTVLMLFHAFDAVLVSRLLDVIEAAAAQGHPVLLIYVNPVYGHLADARSSLHRWFAAYVDHDADEHDYALGNGETVVVWQAGELAGPPHPGCESPIRIAIAGWSAELGV